MGLQQVIDAMGNRIREYAYWGSDGAGSFSRLNVGPDVTNPTPFPWTLSIDKGELETVLTNDLKKRGHIVEYSLELEDYYLDDLENVVVKMKDHKSGVISLWCASYILGCDGPKSRTHDISGVIAHDYGRSDCWVVANMTVDTDLPDIRRRFTIRSPFGNCVLHPYKDDKIRVTTLVSTSDMKDSRWDISHFRHNVSTSQHNPMSLIQVLQDRIKASIVPYFFNVKAISWIHQYHSQKSLSARFSIPSHRVLFLGSAGHNHSPLTKQGINGGIIDAWNLTWKLALVIHGATEASLLATFESERRAILSGALEFDARLDEVFSIRADRPALLNVFANFEDASGYTSGCAIRYPSSFLVKKEARVLLDTKASETLTPGKRLLPLTLTRHIDGNEVSTLDIMPSDGRFNLVLFVGRLLDAAIFQGLSNFLVSSDSPLKTTRSPLCKTQLIMNVFLVHCVPHLSISISDLPQPFPQYPWHIFEDFGGRNHKSVGVSLALGALCLLRPDGHIALVSNLDDGISVRKYMDGILLDRAKHPPGEDL